MTAKQQKTREGPGLRFGGRLPWYPRPPSCVVVVVVVVLTLTRIIYCCGGVTVFLAEELLGTLTLFPSFDGFSAVESPNCVRLFAGI